MKYRIKFFFKVLLFCFSVSNVNAQKLTIHTNVAQQPGGPGSGLLPDAGVNLANAIPASPDAAALGKYGSIPVSPYTGVPNISIPLYTIKSGDLTLPVSISYHSSGNKVEEMASSVGLGWVLNAGGAITRTIRGKPDEELQGFLTQNSAGIIDSSLRNLATLGDTQKQQLDYYLNATADGTLDSEPDIYNYNFCGYSGKFLMDKNGAITVIPLQNIKFKFNVLSDQTTYIDSFTAQTPDGVTYYFGTSGATEFTNPAGSNVRHSISWFLYKIVSPLRHEIDLIYTPESYGFAQTATQTLYQWVGSVNGINPGAGAPLNNQSQGTSNNFNSVKLSQISFENGTLQVYAGLPRLDINSFNKPDGAKMVDSISISSAGLNKLYKFYYYNTNAKRLRLDSLVSQLGSPLGQGVANEKYRFDYSADPWDANLHYIFLFSQDWWGYYNGHGNVYEDLGILVPAVSIPLNSGGTLDLPGANRSPDENSTLGGMLTKITWPTGGYTTFNYEANQEYNTDLHGTSSKYPEYASVTAFSNDPHSIYYNYDQRNGNPLHHISIYNTNSGPLPVHITAYGIKGALPSQNVQQDDVQATISPIDSTGYTYVINSPDTTVFIPPGEYNIKFIDNKGQTDTTRANAVFYSIAAIWNSYTQAEVAKMQHNFIAGGLRIQQISDYDGILNKPLNVKTYKYLMPDTAVSSGWLDFQPVYNYELETVVKMANGVGPTVNAVNAYLARSSVSNYPLATTSGSVVGYSHVEELFGLNGENGKNDYFYDNSETYPDLLSSSGVNFPFAPAQDYDWHRGLLKKEINWRLANNGTFVKVKEKVNVYSTVNFSQDNIGIKAGFNPKPDPSLYDRYSSYFTHPESDEAGRLLETTYIINSDHTYLCSDTTRMYDLADSGKFVQTWNSYQFDPDTYQLNQVRSGNSKNEVLTQTVTHPNEYRYWSAGLFTLLSHGIVTYPVEEITQKTDTAGNTQTVKAVLTTYKAGEPVRDSVFELRSVTPLTDFTASTSSANGIIKDVRYQPVVSFDLYDATGNILQEQQLNGPLHNYIWGYQNPYPPYNNTYPVAEVINADTASIAYTNFNYYPYHSNGFGNWIYANVDTADTTAPMGPGCYPLNGSNTITKNGLDSSAVYTVSFWAKKGGLVTVNGESTRGGITGDTVAGWQYIQYPVTGAKRVTISGSGLIDELRLYPANAQMTTYTYAPLVGISAKCDAKDQITYFIYDQVGRLAQVRDKNHNIVKDYYYQYAGAADTAVQPAQTVYYSSTFSNSFQRNNCDSSSTGSTVTDSVKAGAFTSVISQKDADIQAIRYLYTVGQAYADSVGTCIPYTPVVYYSKADTAAFIRNNCGTDSTGSPVNYILGAGAYTSPVSQAAADSLALAAVQRNGQAYADSTGTCTPDAPPVTYISFSFGNYTNEDYQLNFQAVGVDTTYTINAGGHGTIQVPSGTYTLDVYTNGTYTNRTFTLGQRPDVTGVPRTTFTNVNISSGSNDLSLEIN